MLTREDKTKLIEEIRELWEKSNGLILVNTQKLTAEPITRLRKNCREADIKMRVFKNTLVNIVAKERGLEDLSKFLVGPNSYAFAMGETPAAAKVFTEFKKEFPKKLELVAAVVEGQVYDENGVKALSTLPTRQELLGMVACAFNAPIVKFARVLQANITGIARVLDAVREKKEKAA